MFHFGKTYDGTVVGNLSRPSVAQEEKRLFALASASRNPKPKETSLDGRRSGKKRAAEKKTFSLMLFRCCRAWVILTFPSKVSHGFPSVVVAAPSESDIKLHHRL